MITGELSKLNPVQVTSRAQLTEQSCRDDDDVVLFAASNAHITGPFRVFLNPPYDITRTEPFADVIGMISFSSSSGRNTDTKTLLIFAFLYICLSTKETRMSTTCYLTL